MRSIVQRFLNDLIPLPPPAQREDLIIPISSFFHIYGLEHDAYYLCYRLFYFMVFAGTCVLAAFALDVWLDAGVFIDPEVFARGKPRILWRFTLYMAFPSFFISLLYYLRIRLGFDIRNQAVPITTHKQLFLGGSRGLWFVRALGGTAVGFVDITCTHLPAASLITHYRLHTQTEVVFLGAFFLVLIDAAGAFYLVASALLWEKTIRFFPDLERQLEAMVALDDSSPAQ